jgi:excisionase family DNA binding protein
MTVDLGDFKINNRPNRSNMASMTGATMLTTTEAAEVAAVAPSTIKRWADQGLLSFSRTAGGHRRFERLAVERFVRQQSVASPSSDPAVTAWVRWLVGGRRHEIDAGLLEARARLGSWWRVADEVAGALVAMGAQWQCGQLTVAEEHIASDALTRALARVGDALPTRLAGPTCVLACAADDEHTLGLSLAELCLRELGIIPLWLGRRTPVAELVRLASGGQVSMVALSASPLLDDPQALRAIADEVGAACKQHRVGLLLGGSGAWPAQPSFGVRVTSFAALHAYLAEEGPRSWASGASF